MEEEGSSKDSIFEEREELMVSPTGGSPIFRPARFVFPGNNLDKDVFPVAVRLARGIRIALAPPVLCSIYRDMSLLRETMEMISSSGENCECDVFALTLGAPLQDISMEGRPYVLAVDNWKIPKFYKAKEQVGEDLSEELKSFMYCLRVSQLVGAGKLRYLEWWRKSVLLLPFDANQGMLQDFPPKTNVLEGNDLSTMPMTKFHLVLMGMIVKYIQKRNKENLLSSEGPPGFPPRPRLVAVDKHHESAEAEMEDLIEIDKRKAKGLPIWKNPVVYVYYNVASYQAAQQSRS
nr:serine/threonine-protein phosphatase 7 long form homolog [Ipomoea batatas]